MPGCRLQTPGSCQNGNPEADSRCLSSQRVSCQVPGLDMKSKLALDQTNLHLAILRWLLIRDADNSGVNVHMIEKLLSWWMSF